MSADGGTACRIALEDFEGPLDLLLYLIRRDELDITTIHVAMVADQYLSYIRAAVELDLDIAGDYLVMAATLARMKSRSLLPVERALMEETEDPHGKPHAAHRPLPGLQGGCHGTPGQRDHLA